MCLLLLLLRRRRRRRRRRWWWISGLRSRLFRLIRLCRFFAHVQSPYPRLEAKRDSVIGSLCVCGEIKTETKIQNSRPALDVAQTTTSLICCRLNK
ncbi:hypothetical protein MTBLM1_70063 [Rhodospirillaceae bacterium LM-1]|nr:hypothetical protein MTBLM1_70063 [Rhodospirillaceae bacterium LM-1]